MEQKPLKIKYGTIGFVYVWCYFLVHKYYPDLFELMKLTKDHNFGTGFFFIMFTIMPILPLLACND